MIHESVDVRISRDELIAAMRTDCVTSLAFYLGEDLTLEVLIFIRRFGPKWLTWFGE